MKKQIGWRAASKYTKRKVYYNLHGEYVEVRGIRKWGKMIQVELDNETFTVPRTTPFYANTHLSREETCPQPRSLPGRPK